MTPTIPKYLETPNTDFLSSFKQKCTQINFTPTTLTILLKNNKLIAKLNNHVQVTLGKTTPPIYNYPNPAHFLAQIKLQNLRQEAEKRQ